MTGKKREENKHKESGRHRNGLKRHKKGKKDWRIVARWIFTSTTSSITSSLNWIVGNATKAMC